MVSHAARDRCISVYMESNRGSPVWLDKDGEIVGVEKADSGIVMVDGGLISGFLLLFH